MMGRKAYLQWGPSRRTNWDLPLCLIVSLRIGNFAWVLFEKMHVTNDITWHRTLTQRGNVVSRKTGNGSPYGSGSPDGSDQKRLRRGSQSKTFKVEISFAAKIPMQAIASALRGQESENSQEALRVLDIILRQHAAKQ